MRLVLTTKHPYRGPKTHRYSHEKSTYTYSGRGVSRVAGSRKTMWWAHCSCGWSSGPHDHWQSCGAEHRNHVRHAKAKRGSVDASPG